MKNSLHILAQLGQQLTPLVNQKLPASRLGRRMLTTLARLLGASGGALCAWNGERDTWFCATRALKPESARRLRQALQRPPENLLLTLESMGWVTASPRKKCLAPWPELQEVVRRMCADYVPVLWPLKWLQGPGLVILTFDARPRFSQHFARAVAEVVGLCLGVLYLQKRAAIRGEDYRRIFENSRDMIYLSSRDGRWVEVNPAGVEMLGYESLEELLAVPDSAQAAYLNPADRSMFMAAIEKDGFVKDYEVAFKKKDGTPFYVSITAQVRISDGKVEGYEGIIKDITSRKEAEVQAERQRRLIASILEGVPVAIFMVDRDHRVQVWNRACEELTGVKREDILGTDHVWKVFRRPKGVSLADVVVDQDLAKLKAIYGKEGLRRSLLSEEAWEAEAHFDDLGGRPKDLIFTAALVRDNRGQVVGAVEAIIDSTRIKNLERDLAESEQLYRTLVEANREGIVLHDGERFVFANQAFLEIFGLESLDKAGGDFLELIAPDSRRAYLQWLRNMSVLGGALPIFEGQGLKEDGSSFDLEVIAAPAPYKGREGVLFTVRDVSYRKRMEEQLIRSERLAATGKLAFDIAHEVNNPLGGIVTYAYLMAEDLPRDHEMRPTVDKIIKLANRCKIIVRGLLDFAREDRPEKTPLDVNEVLREMLSLVEGHMIMRGVELVLDLPPGLPVVYGMRNKLEQVFLNLVINAAEAMEGQGRLEVRSWEDQEEGAVKICFRDQGPGMSEEVVSRIFEPFFTTKARGRGTGLGLAICHGIVKQHSGRIEVDSALGRGTAFTVVLPHTQPAAIPPEPDDQG